MIEDDIANILRRGIPQSFSPYTVHSRPGGHVQHIVAADADYECCLSPHLSVLISLDTGKPVGIKLSDELVRKMAALLDEPDDYSTDSGQPI